MTEQEYLVSIQNIRHIYVRLCILNQNDIKIDEIQGYTLDGSIDIDSTSDLRRVCSLKIFLFDDFIPNKNSKIWLNKRFSLEVGIKDLITDEILWFEQGIFLYQSTDISYSSTDKTISVKGADKMAMFTGELGGQLLNKVRFTTDTPITQAIRSTVVDLGKENNILIDNIVDDNGKLRNIPYELEKQAGDTQYSILKELIELYKYEQIYYNARGFFVSEHTKTLLNDPIDFDFSKVPFMISSQSQNDFTYIKNHIKVFGRTVEPIVSIEDYPTVQNPEIKNDGTQLKITFNKALYKSDNTKIQNNEDITSYFEYSGIQGNYTKAVFNSDDWSVLFTIVGENGKIIKPKTNMIYDSCQIPFIDGGYVFSTKDTKWSKLLNSTIITDGINNEIKFKLDFNKPLYNKQGQLLADNTDVKYLYTYTEDPSNFISAKYTNTDFQYYIEFTFNQLIQNAVIESKLPVTIDDNLGIYDSAGLLFEQDKIIMNGITWTKLEHISSNVTYQISYELKNEDLNSPYSIPNLNMDIPLIITDDRIFTIDQAKSRAEYELEIHSNLNEKININCISLFFLDANKLIYVKDDKIAIDGIYKIEKISMGLKISDTMNLQCVKVYK